MSKLTDELRAVCSFNCYVGQGVTTSYAAPFNYEQTMRATRACRDAAKQLDEAEQLLAQCERKIEAYKKQSRNEYPGGPLLQTFMPRLRAFLETVK